MKSIAVGLLKRVPTRFVVLASSSPHSRRFLRPIVNRVMPECLTVVEVRSGPNAGCSLEIDPQREKYYWSGNHEPNVQRALIDVLRPGMTMWDIGAHIGFMSILAARLVGDQGRVHSFEPLPENRSRLQKSIELNKLSNVEVHPEAISRTEGTAVLRAHESSLMWSLGDGVSQDPGLKVSCTTIAAMTRLLGVPDVIKVDAEGHELEILRGAVEILGKQPTRLIVEFTNDQLRTEAEALLPNHRFDLVSTNHWMITCRHD